MRPREVAGGTVTVTMSYAMAVALRKLIARYLCRPEAQLLPPEEDGPLVALYDAVAEVTDIELFKARAVGQADGEEPVKAPKGGA